MSKSTILSLYFQQFSVVHHAAKDQWLEVCGWLEIDPDSIASFPELSWRRHLWVYAYIGSGNLINASRNSGGMINVLGDSKTLNQGNVGVEVVVPNQALEEIKALNGSRPIQIDIEISEHISPGASIPANFKRLEVLNRPPSIHSMSFDQFIKGLVISESSQIGQMVQEMHDDLLAQSWRGDFHYQFGLERIEDVVNEIRNTLRTSYANEAFKKPPAELKECPQDIKIAYDSVWISNNSYNTDNQDTIGRFVTKYRTIKLKSKTLEDRLIGALIEIEAKDYGDIIRMFKGDGAQAAWIIFRNFMIEVLALGVSALIAKVIVGIGGGNDMAFWILFSAMCLARWIADASARKPGIYSLNSRLLLYTEMAFLAQRTKFDFNREQVKHLVMSVSKSGAVYRGELFELLQN